MKPKALTSPLLRFRSCNGIRAGKAVTGPPVHAGKHNPVPLHRPQKRNLFSQFALTHFYGIGRETAHRICARYQIHDRCRVKDLTPTQLTSITAFLSSPSTAQPVQRVPLASPSFRPKPGTITPDTLKPSKNGSTSLANAKGGNDPLRDLKIETELRKDIRQNISHQRMIGSYVGWRHAMGLPVRGQNTQNNAKTAKKLNRIERW